MWASTTVVLTVIPAIGILFLSYFTYFIFLLLYFGLLMASALKPQPAKL